MAPGRNRRRAGAQKDAGLSAARRARAARGVSGAALGIAAALLLSACAPQRVDPGVRPASLTVDGDGALVIDAGGRQVLAQPPAGFCVDLDGVRRQGASVFVLIEDCAWAGRGAGAAPPPDSDPLVMRGLVMLSVGDGPLYGEDADETAAARELESFLRSDEGRASAGMGGSAEAVRIVATRRLPEALYVLVEDDGARASPMLGPRIWRAFTELNGRAAIASLGLFETSRLGENAMLAHLARVVAALRMANGDAVSPEGARLALAAPMPQSRPRRIARVNAGGWSARVPAPRPAG